MGKISKKDERKEGFGNNGQMEPWLIIVIIVIAILVIALFLGWLGTSSNSSTTSNNTITRQETLTQTAL